MDKAAPTPPPPSLTKRQSARNVARLSTKPDALTSDSTSLSNDYSSSSAVSSRSEVAVTSAYGAATPLSNPTSSSLKASAGAPGSAIESPRIDRSVQSRTQYQITLPLTSTMTTVSTLSSPLPGSGAAAANSSSSTNTAASETETPLDQRGWSSPHGEPYRPLGKPDLNLMFSPRLADGSSLLQNAHRMKVFETKDVQQQHDRARKSSSETRHATAAAASGGFSSTASGTSASHESSSHPGLFELFPLNFANKKRPLDERQVKLAHRLHASVSHYSPERVRGLRRSVPSQQQQQLHHTHNDSAGIDSARSHTPSVDLLRHAIHECSSRLRAVKNGAGFLAHVPTSEHFDLLALQDEYHRERAQFLPTGALSHDGVGHSTATRSSGHKTPFSVHSHHRHHHHSPRHFSSEDAESDAVDRVSGDRSRFALDRDEQYLPYTSRRLQASPAKRHPTLEEFKSKLREEKLARPLLSMQTNSATAAASASDATSLSIAASRSSIHLSHATAGGAATISTAQLPRGGDVAGPPMSPRRASIAPVNLASSVSSFTALVATGGLQLSSSGASEGLAPRSLRQTSKSHHQQQRAAPSPSKRHSVERLQAAVDAIEDAKTSHSKHLARTVEALNQDRRDCLAVKFQHFRVAHHVGDDLQHMRAASEAQRVETIDASVDATAWYKDLLKHLLARDTALHPAELLLVRAIRRAANEGHCVDRALMYRLVLVLERDDLFVADVQHVLAFIRHALAIPLDDWEQFFAAHGLPEPVEVVERTERKHERKQTHLARLRTVVTLNQAIRHFSRSDERSR